MKNKIVSIILTASVVLTSACSQPSTVDADDDAADAESYIELAESYHDEGKLGKAISELEKALEKVDSAEIRRVYR